MKPENILDYEEIKNDPPLPWTLELIARIIAGSIAFVIIIPAYLLLCFGVDPLGIKKGVQEYEDTNRGQ